MVTAHKGILNLLEDRRAGWVILLAAVVLRLITLFLVADAPLASDSASEFAEARLLAAGIPHEPWLPPGLPCFLALVHRLGGGEFLARASMLLWFLALALLGYRLALDAAREERWSEEGRRSAQFGANIFLALFACYPVYVLSSVETMSHLPAAAGLMASALLTLRVARGAGTGTAVVLGAALGATALIRPAALLLIVAVPVYLAVRRKKPLTPLAVFLPAAGVVGLWLLVAWNMTGGFVPVNHTNLQNFFYGNNPYTPLYKTWWFASHAGDEPAGFSRLFADIVRLPAGEQGGRYLSAALGEITGRPDLFIVRSLSRVRTYLAADSFTGSQLVKVYGLPLWMGLAAIAADGALYVGIAGAAVAALFAGKKALPGRDALTVLLGIALLYALPYFVSFSHPTFHIPTTPLLGVIAAVFAGRLRRGDVWEKLKKSKKRRIGLGVAAAIFTAIQIEWLVVMAGMI
ncbi:MAG: hypothetical protein A2Y64_03865 [Candidatus Coatesbacteria bacterium RBG_13_66_14]|uniref:Glycosyltransferase RgtA/B/C/D-like domain-containing protein n=1 Tax=Candidatus Coatesbacteria bacterium RBG_13_66_14 TaxID=1817816 RepID=A0A1F5F762_9BACT|nr:MAG: hypothetical protein A2Y64_03865 [Candidatus Coatesbacteria bacterium RBG_13_66_14]